MKIMSRLAALALYSLVFAAGQGAASASACTLGEKDCPVLLKRLPGTSIISASGWVSPDRDYNFKFFAKAGQKINVNAWGGGLKHIGYPLYGPKGSLEDFNVDDDKPVTLPETGFYVINFFFNMMGEGPYGPTHPFHMTLEFGCWTGAEACPVLLRMEPGASTVTASGTVSEARDYHFKFFAKAGQAMVVQAVGASLNPGFTVTGPNGYFADGADPAPLTLPATGPYLIGFSADDRKGRRPGRFTMTLSIE